MKAETAYNVIQALSEEEKNRLLRMLDVTPKVIPLVPPKQQDPRHWTRPETIDYLMRLFAEQSERKALCIKKQNPEPKTRVYRTA